MSVRRGIPGLLAALLLAAPALADVPPPNQCATEGARCDKAGPRFDSPGVCKRRTCHRRVVHGSPPPDDPLGPIPGSSYACLLCIESDAGVAGSGGSPAAVAAPVVAREGAWLATVLEGAGVAAAMLIAGAVAIVVIRRRR